MHITSSDSRCQLSSNLSQGARVHFFVCILCLLTFPYYVGFGFIKVVPTKCVKIFFVLLLTMMKGWQINYDDSFFSIALNFSFLYFFKHTFQNTDSFSLLFILFM